MNTKRLLAGAIAALLLLIGLLFAVPVLVALNAAGVQAAAGCAITELPSGASAAGTDPQALAEAQTHNAQVVVAVGEQLQIPDQGIIVALAVVSQESGFRMLANDALTAAGAPNPDLKPEQRDVDRSLQYPHDGIGHDHGSIGMFQQQYPWWGTIDELMNPQITALKFYQALLRVPGWETMPITVAAQRVQGSAYPDAYAPHEPLARGLLQAHKGAGASAPALPASGADQAVAERDAAVADASQLLCGTGAAMSCPATGSPAEDGLTADALRVLRCVAEHFGPHQWATIGERPAGVDRDHQEGRAVDTMITDRGDGDAIADWAVANADSLGIRYVIFNERIWQRAGIGQPGQWSPYTHPIAGNDSDTAAHRDHVHISVYGDAAGTGQTGSGDGAARLPIDLGKYTISSRYGPRETDFHAGLDFAATTGTPIYAVTGGTVTQASQIDNYGECVRIVSEDHTVETLYAHQSPGTISVHVGDRVNAGDLLGAVGTTGWSTGPHLHLEVRVNNRAVDPEPYLSAKGLRP